MAQSSEDVFGERSRYATLAEARRARLFAEGWLPDVLPEGSGPIAEAHDLVSNARCGRAKFPNPRRAELIRKLLEYGFDAFQTEPPKARGCPLRAPSGGTPRQAFRNGEGKWEPAFALVTDDVFFFWVARPNAED